MSLFGRGEFVYVCVYSETVSAGLVLTVTQADLKLVNTPASVSQMLG